jgi:hypothetical protein
MGDPAVPHRESAARPFRFPVDSTFRLVDVDYFNHRQELLHVATHHPSIERVHLRPFRMERRRCRR